MLLPPGATVPIGSDGNIDFVTPTGIVTFPDGMHGNPGWSDNTYRGDFSTIYTGLERHRWRFGVGFTHLDSKPKATQNFGPGVIDGTVSPVDGTLTETTGKYGIYMEDQTREQFHFSLQDDWSFTTGWELTAGLRYDHYNDFGDTTNPRAALVWSARHDLTAKLLYGRAFRAPALSELYLKNNPSSLGNADLEPETIDTYELVFNYFPTLDFRTVLNLFYYDMNNTINQTPDSGATTVSAKNTDGQRGHGFEMEVEWDIKGDLLLKGNYAWQQSEEKISDDPIADAPTQQAHLSGHWRFITKWSLNTQVNWIGGRKRAATDTRDEINDYTLVDMTLRRTNIFNNWEFALSAHNLFDRDAWEPSNGIIPDDYPITGRSIYGEISFKY